MASNDQNEKAFSKESKVITSSEKTPMVLEDQNISKSQLKKLQKKALKESYKSKSTYTGSSDHQNLTNKPNLNAVESDINLNNWERLNEFKLKCESSSEEQQPISTQPETATNINNQQ